MKRYTIRAVIIKSIDTASTFPYKIPLYDNSSMFLILSFVRIGFKINGVTRSSINPLTSSPTFVAISNQIAIQTILFCIIKSANPDQKLGFAATASGVMILGIIE
jgi:hypothetical protein